MRSRAEGALRSAPLAGLFERILAPPAGGLPYDEGSAPIDNSISLSEISFVDDCAIPISTRPATDTINKLKSDEFRLLCHFQCFASDVKVDTSFPR